MKIRTIAELREETNIKPLQEELKEMYLECDKEHDFRDRAIFLNNISCYEERIKEIVKRRKILSME